MAAQFVGKMSEVPNQSFAYNVLALPMVWPTNPLKEEGYDFQLAFGWSHDFDELDPTTYWLQDYKVVIAPSTDLSSSYE